ncbi:hypothetical protein BOX15_Mlig000764g11, partial [Macrostomum lignano]
SMSDQQQLQFVAFESSISVAFWHRFCKMKLEQLKLSEEPVPIRGLFSIGDADRLPCRLAFEYNAFDTAAVEAELSSRAFAPAGRLLNFNSLDSFKALDKQAFADQLGAELLSSIRSGEALHRPARLLEFSILSYVDLKKYHFYYWLCMPVLAFPPEISPVLLSNASLAESAAVSGGQDLSRFADRVLEFFATSGRCPYFAVRGLDQAGWSPDSVQLISLAEAKQLGLQAQHCTFGYADPSTDSRAAGWPLRNLLVLLAHHWPGEECSVLAYRDRFQSGQRTCSHSRLMRVRVPGAASSAGAAFRCLGWEKSPSPGSGRAVLQPRFVDLSASLSPDRLAESAVDLNLQLMRWRLVPELNLSSLAATRCLLLGAGTLGCNVARLLMGWGVRNITLVDNGQVSYSNPVRQSLFTFADSQHQPGGKLKAEAAAKALIDIFPGVNAQWRCFQIPMPGHAIPRDQEASVGQDVAQLESLVAEHDVVFLLLDSREARWLPTLLAASAGKLAMNAALGFDSYLVMRHGLGPGSRHGCYFCSDVTAPGNSSQDRTLDQQCTVTRPGLAMIAAGLLVELMVSALQHPAGPTVDPDNVDAAADDDRPPMGRVPHQVRGFLSDASQMSPVGHRFDRCSACSDAVLSAYRSGGYRGFLLKVFNDSSHLELVAGLAELHAEAELSVEVLEMDADDDDF